MIGKKDGGPFSKVKCWGIEIKSLFSVLVCKFDEGSRDAFHNHAFNSYSLLFMGALCEQVHGFYAPVIYKGFTYIKTPRERFHKVSGIEKNNWILTIRGPWKSEWKEINNLGNQILTHGRRVIGKF